MQTIQKQILEISGIKKSFNKRGHKGSSEKVEVLGGVSFELKTGTFTSIIGPSGCGKTTLLRIVDGLIQPDGGQVVFNGQSVEKPPEKMGFVFQNFGLLPWRTVQKNVEFGLELKGVDPITRAEVAQKYIQVVGLAGFENSTG